MLDVFGPGAVVLLPLLLVRVVVVAVVLLVSFVILKEFIISCAIGRNWLNLDSWLAYITAYALSPWIVQSWRNIVPLASTYTTSHAGMPERVAFKLVLIIS